MIKNQNSEVLRIPDEQVSNFVGQHVKTPCFQRGTLQVKLGKSLEMTFPRLMAPIANRNLLHKAEKGQSKIGTMPYRASQEKCQKCKGPLLKCKTDQFTVVSKKTLDDLKMKHLLAKMRHHTMNKTAFIGFSVIILVGHQIGTTIASVTDQVLCKSRRDTIFNWSTV